MTTWRTRDVMILLIVICVVNKRLFHPWKCIPNRSTVLYIYLVKQFKIKSCDIFEIIVYLKTLDIFFHWIPPCFLHYHCTTIYIPSRVYIDLVSSLGYILYFVCNLWACLCSTDQFRFTSSKGYICQLSSCHHQFGSICLFKCCHIFGLCVVKMVVASHSVSCFINIPGRMYFGLLLCNLWCIKIPRCVRDWKLYSLFKHLNATTASC